MKLPKFLQREAVLDPKFVSMVGVTEETKRKLLAIMGDATADEVVAALVAERYQEQAR